MIRSVVASAIGVFLAFGVAQGVTHILKTEGHIKSRGMSYFLCVVFVFVASILWGAMAPDTVYPGEEIGSSGRVATEYHQGVSTRERYEIIEKTFFITIIPALIGVRMGLGRKREDEN